MKGEKMNSLNNYNTLVALLKQATDDIKNNAENIVSKWGNKQDLYITIQFYKDSDPIITVSREHAVLLKDDERTN